MSTSAAVRKAGARAPLLLARLGAALVVVGSLAYRTEWETMVIRNGVSRTLGYAEDGVGRWAWFTFLAGLVALGCLFGARIRTTSSVISSPRQQWRAKLALLFTPICLLAASGWAFAYWRTINPTTIDESGERVLLIVPIAVAWGLPIVVGAGTISALAALAYAVMMRGPLLES